MLQPTSLNGIKVLGGKIGLEYNGIVEWEHQYVNHRIAMTPNWIEPDIVSVAIITEEEEYIYCADLNLKGCQTNEQRMELFIERLSEVIENLTPNTHETHQ
tara:strand:+ start:1791 stop:2093 length:303 start_codon:yes stop_codon:yes gene_type:complete